MARATQTRRLVTAISWLVYEQGERVELAAADLTRYYGAPTPTVIRKLFTTRAGTVASALRRYVPTARVTYNRGHLVVAPRSRT
jgi:hypothetical protein